jgi:hypothetical protein
VPKNQNLAAGCDSVAGDDNACECLYEEASATSAALISSMAPSKWLYDQLKVVVRTITLLGGREEFAEDHQAALEGAYE